MAKIKIIKHLEILISIKLLNRVISVINLQKYYTKDKKHLRFAHQLKFLILIFFFFPKKRWDRKFMICLIQ